MIDQLGQSNYFWWSIMKSQPNPNTNALAHKAILYKQNKTNKQQQLWQVN